MFTPIPPTITTHLIYERIGQQTGVPFRVLSVLKLEGRKEHYVSPFNLE